jgi:hypothetical protein
MTFCSVSHRSLLNGDDEPKTLPYAITLNCPTGADAGHYRGTGSFSLDSKGGVLPFASYEIDHLDGVPRYDDRVSGKIIDGVLITDAADVHLPHFGNYQYIRQLIRDLQIHIDVTQDKRPLVLFRAPLADTSELCHLLGPSEPALHPEYQLQQPGQRRPEA